MNDVLCKMLGLKPESALHVPVKALDKDFDLALIGTKGKWYDHTVSVTNPVKVD